MTDEIEDFDGSGEAELPKTTEEPFYEPDDCEVCYERCLNEGVEYTRDFRAGDGYWICEHCGRPS